MVRFSNARGNDSAGVLGYFPRQASPCGDWECLDGLCLCTGSSGLLAAHFDVRKANERVWAFHERFGGVRIGEIA